MSDTEEMELARQLEKLEEANREISGDDDADSYDEEDEEKIEDKEAWDIEGFLFD